MTEDPLFRVHVPALIRHRSGLWVPNEPVGPRTLPAISGDSLLSSNPSVTAGDLFRIPATPGALDLEEPSLAEVEEHLSQLPFEPVMRGLSTMMAAVWFARDDRAKHLKLAEQFFGPGPLLQRLRKFLNENEHHLVFSEQFIAMLMRLLIVGEAPEGLRDDLDEKQIALFQGAMLAIGSQQIIDAEEYGAISERATWTPYLLRMGLYFDRPDVGSDWGRTYAFFVDIFSEIETTAHHWCDLPGWLEEDLAPLGDQLAFGFAMADWADVIDEDRDLTNRRRGFTIENLAASHQLNAATLEPLTAAISADRAELAASFEAAGKRRGQLLWDRVPFEQKPFLRLTSGELVLMSPRFLYAWMGDGFYYRLLDSAKRRKPPSGRSETAAPRFMALHGELMEKYVGQLTRESHADQIRAGILQISSDQLYTGIRRTRLRGPDLVLAYLDTLVVIEVTAGRAARRTRVLSEPDATLEAAHRLIGKMRELDRAVNDILQGRLDVAGLDLARLKRVFPVIVGPSAFMQTPNLWEYIEAESPGLFAGPALSPPTLFAVDEYEKALWLVEQGKTLAWFLELRQATDARDLSPENLLAVNFRNVGRPSYLERQIDRALEKIHAGISHGGHPH
jgi:hypothetical protein